MPGAGRRAQSEHGAEGSPSPGLVPARWGGGRDAWLEGGAGAGGYARCSGDPVGCSVPTHSPSGDRDTGAAQRERERRNTCYSPSKSAPSLPAPILAETEAHQGLLGEPDITHFAHQCKKRRGTSHPPRPGYGRNPGAASSAWHLPGMGSSGLKLKGFSMKRPWMLRVAKPRGLRTRRV